MLMENITYPSFRLWRREGGRVKQRPGESTMQAILTQCITAG